MNEVTGNLPFLGARVLNAWLIPEGQRLPGVSPLEQDA
jgi:hypothetical protein